MSKSTFHNSQICGLYYNPLNPCEPVKPPRGDSETQAHVHLFKARGTLNLKCQILFFRFFFRTLVIPLLTAERPSKIAVRVHLSADDTEKPTSSTREGRNVTDANA